MSALVAGGGLKMGQAIGSSSARGEYPRDRRYTRPQVLSTIYRAIGIDPSHDVPQRQRPADVHPRRPRAGQRAAVNGRDAMCV